MVDFNNEVTVGTPAVDIERVTILQRRYDVLEALEAYRKFKLKNANVDISTVRARLTTYFLEVDAMLERRFGKDTKGFQNLYDKCFQAKSEKEIIEALRSINKEMDKIRLTRIDTHDSYDPQDLTKEDMIKGCG